MVRGLLDKVDHRCVECYIVGAEVAESGPATAPQVSWKAMVGSSMLSGITYLSKTHRGTRALLEHSWRKFGCELSRSPRFHSSSVVRPISARLFLSFARGCCVVDLVHSHEFTQPKFPKRFPKPDFMEFHMEGALWSDDGARKKLNADESGCRNSSSENIFTIRHQRAPFRGQWMSSESPTQKELMLSAVGDVPWSVGAC